MDAIDGGIARVFRFLRDISRIADLASTPSELFDLGPAVQAAIAAEVSEIGHAIPFEPAAALPAVRGNRARFELAVVNLAAKREGDHLVVLVDRDALLELVGTADRNAVLKKLHERAVAELNGQ